MMNGIAQMIRTAAETNKPPDETFGKVETPRRLVSEDVVEAILSFHIVIISVWANNSSEKGTAILDAKSDLIGWQLISYRFLPY